MHKVRVSVGVLISCAAAWALMQAYSVEPVKASWSGWTPFQGNVSQTVTCCWDELKYVQLFAGEMGAAGNDYYVVVKEGGVDVMESPGTQGGDHQWVRFDDWDDTTYKFTKGKTYEFRFTRSGSDSIQYYWDGDDPYKYGVINDADPNAARDLCMRCYGLLDPVDSTYWGIDIPSVC